MAEQDVELTSPQQTHQKYIYMWNIFTENQLELAEDLLYNKNYKKDLHITGYNNNKRHHDESSIPGKDL